MTASRIDQAAPVPPTRKTCTCTCVTGCHIGNFEESERAKRQWKTEWKGETKNYAERDVCGLRFFGLLVAFQFNLSLECIGTARGTLTDLSMALWSTKQHYNFHVNSPLSLSFSRVLAHFWIFKKLLETTLQFCRQIQIPRLFQIYGYVV